ncbi:hypothetical protein ETJ91_00390 [Bacillus albus]|uniref:hypothetical protein n=1 Tax=Bacillus albus TaxID=2026189 RepID=UPI001009E65D|nr:hypothetical protein [Bacillus albus]RXJ19863.1 hypothetical protein ETJ91_00390 [Bacillus albus]RXJ30060.1 hypothetical protein ETJ76_15700 [Bacillus albus]RXJ31652.1 hypothetical protein ETJ90_08475 [Bacillus albus]RXJ42876.1 hypothetical protein ETJ89_08480 [Bacillus albus]RXJ59804.1 hypothetical protein ETJ66_08475 [Bacillus albus]
MAENKKTKTHTSKVEKKEYLFQKVAPSTWLDIMDEVDENKATRRRSLYSAVLENIVVQPKVKLDDFEDSAELDDVVLSAIRFQQGK